MDFKITKNTELKSGDIVVLKNGDELIYVDDEFRDLDWDKNDNQLTDIYDLEDDSFRMEDRNFKDSDINLVKRPIAYNIIYRASEDVKEMTLEQICEELGYNVKVIKKEAQHD